MATVVGLFNDLNTAQDAVDELVRQGFRRYEISLMANASSSEYAQYFNTNTTATTPVADPTALNDADRALTTGEGTGFGAVAGAVTGVIVGLAAFMIPGVGPIIAAGPLIAGLTGGTLGAVAGAATGGIVAALVNSGVPEEEANLYAASVQRGGTLVLVRTTTDSMFTAQSVMRKYNAVDVVQRGTDGTTAPTNTSTTSGTTRTPAAPIVSSTRPSYAYTGSIDDFTAACRQHYAATYANDSRFTYERMMPFYRYGYNLATDPRYAMASWDEVEGDARHMWEEHNPNDAWTNYSDAVHFGWDWVRRSLNANNLDTQRVSKAAVTGMRQDTSETPAFGTVNPATST